MRQVERFYRNPDSHRISMIDALVSVRGGIFLISDRIAFFYSPLTDVETMDVRTTIAAKDIASTDCEKQDGRPSSPSPGIELRTAFELSHLSNSSCVVGNVILPSCSGIACLQARPNGEDPV
jgi:hypothetical protein